MVISDTYLGTVDEFSKRNIGMMAKDTDIPEIACGAIPELEVTASGGEPRRSSIARAEA